MRFCRNGFLDCLMATAIAIAAFSATSYAQFNVSISGPANNTTMQAPTGAFGVTATVTGNANTLTKIVFYRNDVPHKTFVGSATSQVITENQLGQDSYTYRARAYDSQGAWVDSSDLKISVETPRVFKMGNVIPTTGRQTSGPDRYYDHTEDIRAAIAYLKVLDANGRIGGTLYFPCTGSLGGDQQSIYNISDTIDIPSNITLQGESAEDPLYPGRCRMYLNDDTTLADTGCYQTSGSDPLNGKAMFKVEGIKTRIRFRDLAMISRTIGRDCGSAGTSAQIENDLTKAVVMDAQTGGNISDIVFENVSMMAFTNGIKAIGNSISDIKMRAVRPIANHRQLYIDAAYAYDWDVQNFNITAMIKTQGGVVIKRAGAPTSYTGENKKLKFLQLNCNGAPTPVYTDKPLFCISIEKHGGLYLKQMHYEGTQNSIIVEDINTGPNPETNPDPIILEGGSATGEFKDASMKLYLIGNSIIAAPDPETAQQQSHPDKRRMEFLGAGLQSTVVDCGDVHWDRTDTENPDYPDGIEWGDWRMLFTHTERNRESFFAKSGNISYPKSHTVCPSGVPGFLNINEVGGEHFNTGILPVDYFPPLSDPYVFSSADCPSPLNCGEVLQGLLDTPTHPTIFISGSVSIDRMVTIPSGRHLVGGTGAQLILKLPNEPTTQVDLLRINTPIPSQSVARVSGIVVRNLKLITEHLNTAGLAIVGASHPLNVGQASDLHFSGLHIEGFGKGLDVRRDNALAAHQMVDGVSLKNIRFKNNQVAASVIPANISNWSIMDLVMESNSQDDVGWHHANTGSSMQNVTCRGTETYSMKHCIKLEIAGIYLTGLKQTEYVENDLTFAENAGLFLPPYQSMAFANSVLRNNDFRAVGSAQGYVNFIGKAFVTSMNNRYKNFNVAVNTIYQGEFSRITYCGDTFENIAAFPGLSDTHTNLYVGVPTPTRIQCGARPKPWEDVVRLGGEANDKPLAGDFYDDIREDLVIYREGSQSQFLIKKIDGTASQTINWGFTGDVPLIGRFFPGQRAQIVIWRPSNGLWWVYDPLLGTISVWNWGLAGDIPFIGNFIAESGPGITGNKDEIGIYRPSDKTIWIINPRSGQYIYGARTTDFGNQIQIGDFRGLGYDQMAQYQNGIWNILDVTTNTPSTAYLGQEGDVPVSGKYLSGNCTQLGVWRPGTQQFIVADPFSICGTRNLSMTWGSNNDFGGTAYTDDIPLRINTANGALHRPVAYRPTKGVFPYSISNGQWWIHDSF